MRLAHIEARVEQQLELMNMIANAYDNLVKVGSPNMNSRRIHTRLTSLKDDWDKFSIVHEAICIAMKELDLEEKSQLKEHSYFAENLFAATRECYLEATEQMSLLLDSDHGVLNETSSTESLNQPISSVPTYSHQARLPHLDLPKFNGASSEWLNFKDLFQSLVLNNPTLNAIEKLQYLKTSLVGSAAQLLENNTTLSADNFDQTWENVIAFYEDKRALVNAVLQSLFSIKKMSKESASDLEHMYHTLKQIYRSLQVLQRPVSTWDDILVYTATQRLDEESGKAWEHHLGSSRDPPTWVQFTDFLISRLRSQKNIEKRSGKFNSSSQMQPTKTHFQEKAKDAHGNGSVRCSICSGQHFTAACSQYTAKSLQQKLALVNKHRLCYNCLGPHRVLACRSTRRCQKCGKKHHTTIHQEAFQTTKTKSNADGSSSSANTVEET